MQRGMCCGHAKQADAAGAAVRGAAPTVIHQKTLNKGRRGVPRCPPLLSLIIKRLSRGKAFLFLIHNFEMQRSLRLGVNAGSFAFIIRRQECYAIATTATDGRDGRIRQAALRDVPASIFHRGERMS